MIPQPVLSFNTGSSKSGYFQLTNNEQRGYYFTIVSLTCILDKVVMFDGLVKLMVNLALKDGSSKHGKALLASVGENCVLANNLKDFYGERLLQVTFKILLLRRICPAIKVLASVKSLHFVVDYSHKFNLQLVLSILL